MLFLVTFKDISWHIFCVIVYRNIDLEILGKGEEYATNGTKLFYIGIGIFRNNRLKNHAV